MSLGDQTVGLASGLYRARGLYGRPSDAICLPVHALADDCRSGCQPDAESKLPQEGGRGNPELIFMTANRLGE